MIDSDVAKYRVYDPEKVMDNKERQKKSKYIYHCLYMRQNFQSPVVFDIKDGER